MNNSFIFTQPASPAGVEGRESGVEGRAATSPRHSNAPAQPFSNMLDRAVQTPPKKIAEKPKHESLTGGRSAEHRSARSVEAHEEHKPAAPRRGSPERVRGKDKRDDDVTIQPAALAGMPTPVVKPDEIAPASAPSDAMVESSITVENCSAQNCTAQKSLIETTAGRITATQVPDSTEPTRGSAENNLESRALVEGDDVAITDNPPVDLKPLDQALDQDATMTTKTLVPEAEETSTMVAGEWLSEDATTKTPDMQAMEVSTVREALRGSAHEGTNFNASIETPEVAPAADAAAVESGVASPITADEARRSVRADRSAVTEPREKVRGTAAAKLNMSMNNEANREEIAGLTGQVLPGSGVSQAVTGINLPSESNRIAVKEITGIDSLNAAARLTTGPARTDVSLNSDLLEMREASPAARIGEVISREVRMFKRGGDDMVEVVLTPDAKTQISLKLQWRDGQVEVQARCDMGDHRFLNTQWSQLQASFAAHGVRLSHLSERAHTGFTEFFGNSGFSQQHGGDRQPARQQSAIDVMKPAVPTPKTGAARSVVRSSNRLESWA